jgi:phosphotransferase family enzyme
MNDSSQSPIIWSDIENSLHTLEEVEGGFTNAHRGIITLPSGEKVFVKIGVDDTTKEWVQREIETYQVLESCGYKYAPLMLASNPEKTAFAIQALPTDEHWDWTTKWSDERLTATIEAMDALAGVTLSPLQREFFATAIINETQDGWRQLVANADSRRILDEKLRAADREDIVGTLDLEAEAEQSRTFIFTQDTLVHSDVRADNCAWNPQKNQVRLVDWNWAQLGDERIDTNALLVSVQKAGIDVIAHHKDSLDKDALHWLAGYWLNGSTQSPEDGGSEKPGLRDYQFASGLIALDLSRTLSAH